MKGTLLGKHFLGLLIAVAFCLSAAEKAQAQWVNVPDDNFRKAIAALAPSAIFGDFMDTTDAGIDNIYSLSSNSGLIYDLTGVEYLRNLTYLECRQNHIYTLGPRLPAKLTYLDCTANELYSLPDLPPLLTDFYCGANFLTSILTLPSSIKRFACNSNKLTSLPALPALNYFDCNSNELTSLPTLPSSLTWLICDHNKLTSLPTLPSSLTDLNCIVNLLTSLPPLPSALKFLDCRYNNLDSLPYLPASLTTLDCSYNYILTSLPSLPASLASLSCPGNSISSLPALPASLKTLTCFNNSLTTLPNLPSSLATLWCSNNSLTALPVLPASLTQLKCNNNFISCLPLLPESLQILNDSNAGNTCLPNLPAKLTSIVGPSIVCDPHNSTCYAYPIISGSVYNDDNLNALLDGGEIGHPNVIIQVQPGNYFIPTSDSTYYSYVVDSGVAYTITTNTLAYYNITPLSQSGPALYYGMVDSLNDFALQRIGIVHDFNVKITSFNHPTRGSNMTHALTVKNNGTVTDTAYLQYVFDSNLTYISSSPAASVVNGDTLQWNSIRLIPGQKSDFQVTFHIDNSVPLSTNLYSYAVVNPVAADTTPVDNVDTLHQVVIGSYDPNDKAVTPEGAIPLAKIVQGQWLDYTIRFQNTGTAPAFKVEIKDTLSSKLDLSTLQIVSSSHEMIWSVRHSVAYFEFENINLPDSGADEAASHGFVRYRMKAHPNLSAGDMIKNTAYIYFDQNSAIVTNTTSNNVCQPNARNLAVNICHGETYTFNGLSIDSAGTYYSTLTNISGCDSVITLQLAISHTDTSVMLSQDTLVALAGDASYQWINCTTGFQENGATDYFFIPPTEDEYAVIVNQNNCVDTSACYSVLLTGVASLKNNFRNFIYPNPAHDEIMINGRGMFIIMNLLGEKVSEGMLKQDGQSVIIKDLPMGIYFVQVVNDNGRTVRRFLKQ